MEKSLHSSLKEVTTTNIATLLLISKKEKMPLRPSKGISIIINQIGWGFFGK